MAHNLQKAEINEYEKSTMTKVKDLERGASAVPAVVTVPDLAAEVVAKYFTSNQVDPADEIECLMKVSFPFNQLFEITFK